MFKGDEKLTSRVFRLYSHQLHQKRLSDIKSKLPTRINNSAPRSLKYQQLKRTGYNTQLKARKSHINRENEKISQMISDITDGKRASSIQYTLESSRNSPKPRSLNLVSRRKEARRIIEDNYSLAKRISETTRGVSFKKFDEDWLNITRYMNSISKKNIRKLPKLEIAKHTVNFASFDLGGKRYNLTTPGIDRIFSPNLVSQVPGNITERGYGQEETPQGHKKIDKKQSPKNNNEGVKENGVKSKKDDKKNTKIGFWKEGDVKSKEEGKELGGITDDKNAEIKTENLYEREKGYIVEYDKNHIGEPLTRNEVSSLKN